jgi:hypothetical protein
MARVAPFTSSVACVLPTKLYSLGCRVESVKPVRHNFLSGEIPCAVIRHMEEWQNEGASAGR